MPGKRRAGLGLYSDASPPHPPGIAQRGGFSMPVSGASLVPEATRAGRSSSDSAAMVSANGLTVRLGATTYRVLPPGARPAADEELVDEKRLNEVLERAAQLDQPGDADFGGTVGSTAALLAELHRSSRA